MQLFNYLKTYFTNLTDARMNQSDDLESAFKSRVKEIKKAKLSTEQQLENLRTQLYELSLNADTSDEEVIEQASFISNVIHDLQGIKQQEFEQTHHPLRLADEYFMLAISLFLGVIFSAYVADAFFCNDSDIAFCKHSNLIVSKIENVFK
jgi:cytoplasmic iron level regulating protein YaaA (DUF328/UPF0246 family)